MSRPILIILAIAVLVLIVLFATGFWSVDQTREAKLPDVEVQAQGGQLPAYDVDSKEVVVGTTTANIEVPKVETKTEQVQVPVVGVKDNGEQ
ncbi:hypothetical protein [Allosphingosinicella indica]|uniref:Uncharacterized protein n=1 Tax=Allosphingosinicella indica TaxID=941907 RepID=A0A1X7G0C0_9SPHN|nr:hypothetical protein [Allosphingosinicella indica]SMF61818.1 hypothetical protein SAMN06295910_0812 [Allosphingosinicella indica]